MIPGAISRFAFFLTFLPTGPPVLVLMDGRVEGPASSEPSRVSSSCLFVVDMLSSRVACSVCCYEDTI